MCQCYLSLSLSLPPLSLALSLSLPSLSVSVSLRDRSGSGWVGIGQLEEPCPVLWDMGLGLWSCRVGWDWDCKRVRAVLSFGMGLDPLSQTMGWVWVCVESVRPDPSPMGATRQVRMTRVLCALPRHMGGPAAEVHRMRLQSFEACVAPQQILDGQGFGATTPRKRRMFRSSCDAPCLSCSRLCTKKSRQRIPGPSR